MHTRVSAYALAVHNGHVLLTQLAEYCTSGGSWTLPGGGMDHGEQPAQTLAREAYEETGLEVHSAELVHARSYSESHRGPFMAVQLVYRAHMRGDPVVIEQGGSTAAVAWIPLTDVAALPTVGLVDEVLALFHP